MFDDVTDILLALVDISSILGVTVAKDEGTDIEHKCLVGLCNINKHNFDFCQVLALD